MGAREPIANTAGAEVCAVADTTTITTAHSNVKAAPGGESVASATATSVSASVPTQLQQQHLPKAAPPPQVIIIPATQASTIATNAAKKIRRAFSMPRNPFRWSRKFKTSTAAGSESSAAGSNSAITSCVGGGRGRAGSIVSLSSYEAIVCKDAEGNLLNDAADETSAAAATTTATTTSALPPDGDRENGKVDKQIGKQTSGAGVVASNGVGSNSNTGTSSTNRVLRRSSLRKFLNRIAQHVSSTVNAGANKHATTTPNNNYAISTGDRVPPIGVYQWPADQTPGVMGLKNHGNTCFMNAVLQCLSHTDLLAEYFVLDQYKADLKRRNKINSRKFGTKGELTEQLANVLKALWTCKNESDHSTSFKAVVDRYGSQFRSSTQHDAQEFLFWLLDKVHEDLNTATKRRYKSVKNSYGRPDEVIAAETLANHIRCNNSFVQAVFQAQFRSSLTCPRCKKQSNTFDPFHCISVQLPQLTQQTIFVTVVYLKQHPRQVKLGLRVPAGSPIVALREQLQADTGIANERMVLVDINKEGFTRVFYDTQPVATLKGIETIYCIEVPEAHTAKGAATAATTTATTNTPKQAAAAAPTAASAKTKDGDAPTKSGSVGGSGTGTNSVPTTSSHLLLLVANVRKKQKLPALVAPVATDETADDANVSNDKLKNDSEKPSEAELLLERFGTPFSVLAPRDCSYAELQKKLLREMSAILKPDVFSYATPPNEMFQMRLQDPSADPDTYLEQVEHPLLTEMIDLALSVLSAEAGPAHVKLLLEWSEPEQYFADITDSVVEHESVARLREGKNNDTAMLTLEQCLEHYTKAETLSAEDAWRCPHCQQYLPVVKTLGLWSLPDILVVHFKRFRQHQVKGPNAAKLTTMVTFPLNAFDMSPHLAREATNDERRAFFGNASTDALNSYRPSPWKRTRPGDSRSSTLNSQDNRETRYDLYAVCYHQGDTLETGHYTAACKNPYDHQWYKFDDQRVSKVPSESIQEEIVNNEAYMLFYQRRSSENAESSGSSSNSGDHWVSRIAPPPTLSTAAAAEKVTTATNDKTAAAAVIVTNGEEKPVEKLPEKAETKPVNIPNVHEVLLEEAKEDIAEIGTTNIVPNETLAQLVVNNKKHQTNEKDLGEIEEFDFADADADAVIDVNGANDASTDDELHVLETLSAKETLANTDDANQIFVMDEDCQISEGSAEMPQQPKDAKAVPLTLPLVTVHAHAQSAKTKTSPLTNGTASAPIGTAATGTATTAAGTCTTSVPMANGYECGKSKSPRGTAATSPRNIQRPPAAHTHTGSGSSASSSSASSLSSRSSPHSLAASVNAASTLQTKFNGFSASSMSASNYKEALLSNSLKSNSSSIIGAAVAAQSHEFQLSRHQHNHWHGSRSSVSAVESASTQQTQQQAHCLNLRHSFSTSSNYKLRECNETLSSMLRNSANTCSKDTLIFIDQQNHHHHHHHHHNHHSLMEDDDDGFMGSRSLWISPVTPHKLITVSPKN